MKTYYTTWGPVTGTCGHQHRTVRQLIREVLSAGWTQVQLAEELTLRGYPTAQPTISRWLSGRRPMRRATEIVLRQMLEAILAETD